MDGRPNRRNIAVFSNSQAMQMTAMPTDHETSNTIRVDYVFVS